MKKTMYIIVMAMLCLNFKGNSQIIKPLKIGDKIPDEIWNMQLQVVNHPKGNTTTTLKELKKKLIILDFWYTGCSACIGNFPKSLALQKDFEGEVEFLLVDFENRKKVHDFFTNRSKKEGKSFGHISVVEDTNLKKMFPHKSVPHYVWIAADGTVIATTSAKEITSSNIQNFLNKSPLDITMKVDQDLNKPLFSSEALPVKNLLQYSILVKGHLEGTGSGSRPRIKEGQIVGRLATNTSLLKLYEVCFLAFDMTYETYKLAVSVTRPDLLFQKESKLPVDQWYNENEYSFDFIVPIEKKDSLYHYMLDYLNRNSPYLGTIEKRKKKALVLVKSNSGGDFYYKTGAQQSQVTNNILKLNNVPIHYLTERLNKEFHFGLTTVDSTGYTGKINIEFKTAIHDLPSLKKELNRHGLDLIEREIMLNEFKISDRIQLNNVI